MKAIGLVLGSGGARGLSFIGVLEVLERLNVPIRCIVGSSMGAIIGGAYCAGVPLVTIRDTTLRWRRRDFARFSPLAAGLCSHQPLQRLITNLVPARRFEDLTIPLKVVCTDLQQGQPVVYESGPLLPAILGSSVAAGLLEAVHHEGRVLVDGGYTDPVPARHAPTGIPLVIVDPSALPDRLINIPSCGQLRNLWKPKLVFDQALKSMDILIYRLGQESNRGVQAMRVQPSLGDISFIDFHRGAEAIEAGRVAMSRVLDEFVKQLHDD